MLGSPRLSSMEPLSSPCAFLSKEVLFLGSLYSKVDGKPSSAAVFISEIQNSIISPVSLGMALYNFFMCNTDTDTAEVYH